MVDDGLDGCGPNLVAFPGGIGGIDHGVGAEGAVGLEELVAEIEEEDFFAVGIGSDEAVDGAGLVAHRVGGFLAARPECLEEDRGFGTALLVFGDDGVDALGGLFGSVGAEVIAADLEDDEPGMKAIDLAALQTPKERLGGISAVAKIKAVELAVTLPHSAGWAVITRGNRPLVAIKEEVDFALLPGILEILGEIIEPVGEGEGRCGGGVGVGGRRWRGPDEGATRERGGGDGESQEGGEGERGAFGESKERPKEEARKV